MSGNFRVSGEWSPWMNGSYSVYDRCMFQVVWWIIDLVLLTWLFPLRYHRLVPPHQPLLTPHQTVRINQILSVSWHSKFITSAKGPVLYSNHLTLSASLLKSSAASFDVFWWNFVHSCLELKSKNKGDLNNTQRQGLCTIPRPHSRNFLGRC